VHPLPPPPEVAWSGGAQGVYLSFDIDSIDPGSAPGTGWPEPGGLYPREALKLVRKFAAEGLLGMEIVEVSPPYDVSDITALMGVRGSSARRSRGASAPASWGAPARASRRPTGPGTPTRSAASGGSSAASSGGG
jgi:hypothetical protein